MPLQLDQIIRFCGVGGVASALYFLFATCLNAAFGLAATPASVLAYFGAAVFAFNAHRRITFRGSDNVTAELIKFGMATGIGLGLALLIPLALTAFAPVVSFLAVLVIVPSCSFLMMKFFVFAQ